MARGRIFAFYIDLLRRLYNTLVIPCECVITKTCRLKTEICNAINQQHRKLCLYMGCSDVSEFEHIYGQILTTPSCVYGRLFT